MTSPAFYSINTATIRGVVLTTLLVTQAIRAADLKVGAAGSPMTLTGGGYNFGAVTILPEGQGTGTRNLGDGVTLTCTTFYNGDGSGGVVNQTGGDVTVTGTTLASGKGVGDTNRLNLGGWGGPYQSYYTLAAAPTPSPPPASDPNGDGMNNQQEYAFGLNPTTGASANPCTPLHSTQFSYTTRHLRPYLHRGIQHRSNTPESGHDERVGRRRGLQRSAEGDRPGQQPGTQRETVCEGSDAIIYRSCGLQSVHQNLQPNISCQNRSDQSLQPHSSCILHPS
jgi:hypothetical protein